MSSPKRAALILRHLEAKKVWPPSYALARWEVYQLRRVRGLVETRPMRYELILHASTGRFEAWRRKVDVDGQLYWTLMPGNFARLLATLTFGD